MISFSTDHRASKPHTLPVPLFTGGETEFLDDARGFASEVQLIFTVPKVDWASYMVSLYVLLHECVCHAFAGLAGNVRQRPALDEDDPFAEGWMDWIVSLILEDIANGSGPARAIAQGLPWRSAASRAGRNLHFARAAPERENEEPVMSIGRAVNAAIKTYEAMQEAVQGAARKAMLELSLDLNLLGLGSLAHDRLIRSVERHLAAPGTVGHTMACRALRVYTRSRDVSRFLNELPEP